MPAGSQLTIVEDGLENLDTCNIANPDGTIDKHLICDICDKVLKDPKECDQCQNAWCNNCLVKLNPKDKCPNGCAVQKYQPIHKKLEEILHGRQFYCGEGCEKKELLYEEALKH